MSDFDLASQRLRETLSPGQHTLTNAQLRDIYGVGRVTAKTRAEIIVSLGNAGFEVEEQDATTLRIRLRAAKRRGAVDRPAKPKRPWWQLKRVWIPAGLILLFILLPGEDKKDSDSTTANAAAETATATPTSTPTPTPTPSRSEVLADAKEAVADDDYNEALVLVAALGDDDDNVVRRYIGRRVRYRVRRALRQGDRTTARRLLRSPPRKARRGGDYRSAVRLVDAADAAARQRRAEARAARIAARQAREQAAAQRRAEREAARAAEEAAEQAEQAPDESSGGYTGNCDSSPSDIPVPPGSDGDRDGDGIACES